SVLIFLWCMLLPYIFLQLRLEGHDIVIPLPQTDIVGAPKGTPHVVMGYRSVRNGQHRQAPLHHLLSLSIPPGPANRMSFVGLLSTPSPAACATACRSPHRVSSHLETC